MNKKGFTLIELLVVVAIISLLSSIVLASIRDARQKAQDSQIAQTIQQAQNALELFKNEYGYYPYGYFQAYNYGVQTYYEDFNSDPNNANINKFMNFESTFSNVILPEATEITYINNTYTSESGWGWVWSCDPTQTYTQVAKNSSYTILFTTSDMRSFSKFKPTYILEEWQPTTPNLAEGYWYAYPTACFSIE